jgi:phage I-like protein
VPQGDAPEWLHILPPGALQTVDGRGPFKATNLAELARRSLELAGGRLPLDENHSIDLAAPEGGPSPARGWIVELEERPGGIWGRVEWTNSGRSLMADKAYRFLSPVFEHLEDGEITALLRVALTNNPNLRQLTALNQERNMDLLQQLCAALGLGEDADAAKVVATVKELKGSASQVALQAAAALKPIAVAAGAAEDADAETVLAAVTDLRDPAKMVPATQVAALQSELAEVKEGIATEKAEAYVDAAIAAGKPGVKPLRDHYIARHMADPAAVETELGSFPSLTAPSGARPTPPGADGNVALNAADQTVIAQMGLDPEAYQKTLAADAAKNGEGF